MDLKYFKNQICDEIEGSKDYILKAIELKPMNNEWSKTLIQMSEAEEEHATNLYIMMNTYFEKLQKGYKEVPQYMIDLVEKTGKLYNEGLKEISNLQTVFQKL